MRTLAALLMLSIVCVCFAGSPDWEQQFRAVPDPTNLREYVRQLSARPHHVGSAYDKANAEWIASKLKTWGLDVQIENFYVLFPTPDTRLLEMLEPAKFTAKLEETAVPVDPTSNQKDEQLPSYNAYSIDGDVTAPLVYVNFGVPDDYEQLATMGVSVRGAIVIARYGGAWRGIKPKLAAEHGALGCIIYSDPHEDGFSRGQVFPQGPERPVDGVQRGSVMDMPLYPGDPLTPGIGAVKDAKRLPISEARTLTRIPVLPISYGDAEPLLKALQGPVAPPAWRGALPITYHIGAGPAKVHLKVTFHWDQKTLYDVIAKIPGSQYPDEWVIRGNHHDAWVNGADDPVSGAAAELEEARGLGSLLARGWKPKRTIIYAFWDGEEPGLLGSTEWVETHAEDLEKHAVAYINTDHNSRGFLDAEGCHMLEHFLNGVMKDVVDPETGLSVWKRLQLRDLVQAKAQDKGEIRSREDLRIGALGAGSDYTSFVDHMGIASLNLSFGDEGSGGGGSGVYHSAYDDFYWYTHFADSDFIYGRALAQTIGTAVIRLADANVLPLQFSNFANTVLGYVKELKKLAVDQRQQIEEQNREIDEGAFQAAADPQLKTVVPAKQAVPPDMNFAPLESAAELLAKSASSYAEAERNASPKHPKILNAKLIETERGITDAAGLPGRPWFKNVIYAPGLYTGYGVKTIPGVREAIEQKRWKEADEEIRHVADILRREAALIDAATMALAN